MFTSPVLQYEYNTVLLWSSRNVLWTRNVTWLSISVRLSRWWVTFHFWVNFSFNLLPSSLSTGFLELGLFIYLVSATQTLILVLVYTRCSGSSLKVLHTKFLPHQTQTMWSLRTWNKTQRNGWMGSWMDGFFAMFSLLPPDILTLYSVPNLFLPVTTKPEMLLAVYQVRLHISWHPFVLQGRGKGRYRVTDRTFPGLQGRADGSEINRSDAWDWMARIRQTDYAVGLEKSRLCPIIHARIKSDAVEQAAKWPTMTRLVLEWQR